MAEHKINIGDSKSKKTYKKTVEDISGFFEKKIGDTVNGEVIDLAGYEFEITGGSDASGFPMRKDVDGIARKRILITSGVGMKSQKRKGLRLRKMVAGNTIFGKTSQINLKVTKWGKGPIEPVTEEVPAETKAEE